MKYERSLRFFWNKKITIGATFFLLALGCAVSAGETSPPGSGGKSGDSTLSPPIPSDKFETTFIRQQKVRDIILFDGRESAARITKEGAFKRNAELWEESKTFNVDSQRQAYLVIAAGIVASSSAERAELLDKGLKSLEWPFDRQRSDGSFPSEKNEKRVKTEKQIKNEKAVLQVLHIWSMFLQEAAHSIILIRQAPDVDRRIKERAEALVPKLHRSAALVANSENLDKFFEKSKVTNQMLNIALAIHETGVITSDAFLLDKAKSLVLRSLKRQTEDGTFPEIRGFDSAYQTFSLELLTRYAITNKDQALQRTILVALEKGMEKFRQNAGDDGQIFNGENSRTGACGPRIPGTGPKGKNIDIIPLRLYYYGYFTNKVDTYGPIAQKILTYGQGHDHMNTCAE